VLLEGFIAEEVDEPEVLTGEKIQVSVIKMDAREMGGEFRSEREEIFAEDWERFQVVDAVGEEGTEVESYAGRGFRVGMVF